MTEPLSYSTATPRLGLPMLFAGQAQKETTVNEALVAIDILLSGSVEGVIAAPPITPDVGMAWIVGPAANGEFAGKTGQIAGWTEGGWRFIRPVDGMRMLDREAAAMRHYSDGWTLVSSPLPPVGGTVIDIEARACIAALISALEEIGVISTS